jgi:hypothetical protein
MHYGCYLRKGIVYLSTFGKVESGGYRGTDPRYFVPVAETANLRHAFQEIVARGNPIVPSLNRGDHPPSPLLKYAGVKTWSAFNRTARSWSIDERDGIYQIVGQRKGPHGGFVDDPEQTVTMPSGSTADDVIDRVIAILQAAARK